MFKRFITLKRLALLTIILFGLTGLYLFFPLLAGTGGFRRSVIDSVEGVYNKVSETVSNVINRTNSPLTYSTDPNIIPSTTNSKNDSSSKTESDNTESESKLTCKFYDEVETADFKIYEVDGIVRVEVKGDYADSAVDYLRGHGCAPLASENIVYVINGKEIRL